MKNESLKGFSRAGAVMLLAVLWAKPATADAVITGPGCAVDGNTVQVGSKLKNGECWGGINVRLHGSVARKFGEKCTATDGSEWDCGRAAKNALARMIKSHSITCYHLDGEFDGGIPIVTCISGRLDLALELVHRGMAEAAHDTSKRYELEETDAKQARRGIWK